MNETRKNIYDEICRVLTEWETQEAVDADLYQTLVKVQNNWETVITAYDLDKIVADLEYWRDYFEDQHMLYGEEIDLGRCGGLYHAIEVVRKGGI